MSADGIQPDAPRSISSAIATGQAGGFFEQHVNAAFLAHLLVRAIPPVLTDCVVEEVHFQTEHLGWSTDDVLIIGTRPGNQRRRLAGQVKRSFTVSSKDDECRKAFVDFWRDFQNPRLFARASDRLALIVQRGTNTLLEHLNAVLDCARAAIDASDFANRLQYLHSKSRTYQREIRGIIESEMATTVSDTDFWEFLRVIHVLSFDLNTSTNQTEAWIKTLLAQSATGHDKVGAAQATWNSLVVLVSGSMPNAGSFTWGHLPEALRQSHSPVSDTAHGALQQLRDHSTPILNQIRSAVGSDVHVPRDSLVTGVLEALVWKRIVLVSGPAGSGKSAVAKEAFEKLRADHFAFAFRAEEFATPHLDDTLHRSNLALNAVQLGGLLAGQARKVLLIESIERLLEAPVRDGFADLLQLIRNDESWDVILTCRDYSAGVVRSALLDQPGLEHEVVQIPLLNDQEIDAVAAAIPKLQRPVAGPSLRRVFRNLYILDKAARMEWSPEGSLPHDERSFRERFWREIVRDEAQSTDNLPRRREQAFVQVALRRASSLARFASCDDLDPAALQRLRQRDLLEFSEATDNLAAPAHDVLEDWAILQWLDERHVIAEGQPAQLCAIIGGFPAIRRAYRKWLGERLQCLPQETDQFVLTVLRDLALSAHFRDDTLVSVLLSENAGEFVRRNQSLLLANGADLLNRVIHLMRVACKAAPPWLPNVGGTSSLMLVPEGSAWASVLEIVHQNVRQFLPHGQSLLIGLIEDWSRAVAWWSPAPAGIEHAAGIAFALLPYLDGYESKNQRRTVLEVISKIPHGQPDQFVALIRKAQSKDEHDDVLDDFAELALEESIAAFICREFPDEVIRLAETRLVLTDAQIADADFFSSDLEFESLFGLRWTVAHHFFPPSALRGPFLPLLQYHPAKGIEFILRLLNHCVDWYAHPRVRRQYVEAPTEISVSLSDGTTLTQWCNGRLWNLYRGTSVGPYLIKSVLMALELWLLDLSDSRPEELEAVLSHLLRNSNNCGVSAVVASVAIAKPQVAGTAGLMLLRCPAFIQLDRMRLVHETQAPSSVMAVFPLLDPGNRVYENERKAADALPHRRLDLEALALNLQGGRLQDDVWRLLDEYRGQLPPNDQQTDEDRLWRLALHRMDIRKFVAEPPQEENQVVLRLSEPDADIQQMLDEEAPAQAQFEANISLLMWGYSVYDHQSKPSVDPSAWRQRLAEAKAAFAGRSLVDDGPMFDGGPGYVAAVCVRDHWDGLPADDREWCIETLIQAVLRDCDNTDQMARAARNVFDASRPAAFLMSFLIGRYGDKESQIVSALAAALTHSTDEVVAYAVEGVGVHLWQQDRDLADVCSRAIAAQGVLASELWRIEEQKPFDQRRPSGEIERHVRRAARQIICEQQPIEPSVFSSLDLICWWCRRAMRSLLAMVSRCPDEAIAVEIHQSIANALVATWDSDRRGRRQANERDYEFEQICGDRLSRFSLRAAENIGIQICQPIIDVLERHPDKVAEFIHQLVSAEDQLGEATRIAFWRIWSAFANRVRLPPSLAQIDSEHSSMKSLMDRLFLASYWKENIRHWPALEGFSDRPDALFQSLPPSTVILAAYVRYLFDIGEQSLPNAFVLISQKLQSGNARIMLAGRNTIFCLDSLLRRFVYGTPARLKSDPMLREATLHLLDELVESGSSAAYRMRDDFITPLSTTSQP